MSDPYLERRLVLLCFGYFVWVVPATLKIYLFSLFLIDPTWYLAATTFSIILITAVSMSIILNKRTDKFFLESLVFGIAWVVISLVFDIGLVAYNAKWHVDIIDYITTQAWQFAFIPVTCLICGVVFSNIKRTALIPDHARSSHGKGLK